MILLAFKSLFFVAAIFAYSIGVWRLINDYFRQEFRTFLDEEVKKNKYLVVDPTDGSAVASPPEQIISESQVQRAQQGSVTANRLLDELIVNFGRLFTAGGGSEIRARKANSAQPPPATADIVTSSSTGNAPTSSGPEAKGASRSSSSSSADPVDPGGGGTVIESDKLARRRSGSSRSEREDNKSDGSDGGDDANEEKWITYWKNRESVVEGGDSGHCEVAAEAVMDACEPPVNAEAGSA